jgi:serine/threonine protein phosphatase PrpC
MSNAHEIDTVEIPPLGDLFKHFGPSAAPIQVTFGALSHAGKVRANNQDHYIVVERRRSRSVLLTNIPTDMLHPGEDTVHVLAVADGMGGAAFGELASLMALRNAFDLGHSAVKWVFKVTEQEIKDLYEQLEAILRLVHRELVEQAQADKTLAGMGTTLTGAYLIGAEAFIAHVGDSRAYLYRNGILRRLTRDHTVAQDMIDSGNTRPEAVTHHMLTNCLGGMDRDLHVDFQQVHLEDCDRLLFCTDGLTNMVPEEQIAGTLKAHPEAQDACRVLVEQALEQGGKDNVTVIVASFASRERAA